MDSSSPDECVDIFLDKKASEDNEKTIRTFFTQGFISPSISNESNGEESEKKAKPKPDNKNFYKTFMEAEVNKYKEMLKSVKPEKIINDFKPSKRNPNEFLLDIGEEYIISKKGNWANLCILEYQEKLLQAIRNNQIVIIKGFTGCGKSTQIPQYIAVDCQNQGQAYNIIVTQPRRVAAKMLATRVSYELECTLGTLVGYQIGLDRSKDSKLTKILYVTTGVLLQRLIMSSNLNFFTHIVLDEIHERSADMDMLFLILKKKIFEGKLNARIILMSATCDVDLFQHYFTYPSYVMHNHFVDLSPAVIEINSSLRGKGNGYRQEIFYLDDIVGKIGNLRFNYSQNMNKYVDFDDFLLANADEDIIFNKAFPILHKILPEVVLGILFHGIEIHQIENQTRGAVLIFLPGLAEILEMLNILKSSPYASRYKWKFFILHSTVSLKEQTEVMRVAIDGSRHIILATNIAESSLTVPNVEFVIDFCLCKTLIASRQGYNMTYLALEWSSKSSSDQRAGRTGRTNHGQVFRLIPNQFYQTLSEYEVPEFEKTPLENYVLKAKLIDDTKPPKHVLAYALNPPKLEDVEQAVLTLKRVGAFTVYLEPETEAGTKYDDEDGNMTALGYIMAFLPLDIMLSKLVALGLVFDVTYEAIVIAAAHCTTGFFMKNTFDPVHTYKSQLSWSNRSLSDSLAYLKAYRMYKTLESKFNNNTALAQKWCYKNNIEYQRLLELETLISEITTRLEMNLKIDLNFCRRSFYKKSEQELIIKVIISGAFYPNYFIREFVNEELIDRYQSEINCENTVVMTGFSRDSLTTALYIPFLKKLFDSCSSNIDFKIEGNVVFMTLDSNNHEISIENEDHPLYLAYSSHINAQQIGQTRSATLKNWSSFHETNVHTSVFLALALKKFMRNQITLNRYRLTIENFHRSEIVNKIKRNGDLLKEGKDDIGEGNVIAKVCQHSRKYLLPRMPTPVTSALFVGVRIINFLTPHLFYVMYKHAYLKKMLYNIDTLTQLFKHVIENKSTQSLAMVPFGSAKEDTSPEMSPTNCQLGDLVIAPFYVDKNRAVVQLVSDHKITTSTKHNLSIIWARAEIQKFANYNNQEMVSLFYIDFGITDTLPVGELHRLQCRNKYSVDTHLRDALTEADLEQCIINEQDAVDKLFCIPALAVRSELVLIKPSSAVEYVGNWMPQVKKFIADYCIRHNFSFTAKVYAFLNDRLYVELYPIHKGEPGASNASQTAPSAIDMLSSDEPTDEDISVNELLVKKKFAEFKLETDVCQQMNFRRSVNHFHEAASTDAHRPVDQEFGLVFDRDSLSPAEYQFDINQLTVNTDRQFTHNVFRVRGPLSPLEVKFSGLSRLNSTKTVNVSTNSINSIALEPDVTAKHARLLVAGEISLSEINPSRLSLSNTTFMPNIVDFPAFMCLLFSPHVELRVNKLVSERVFGMAEEVCGAICGIGAHPDTNRSYDIDNDIDIIFDSSVNIQDIELINLLRYQIGQFFYSKEQQITGFNDPNRLLTNLNLEMNLGRRQRKCREILLQILTRTRVKRKWFDVPDPQCEVGPTYQWNAFTGPESSDNYRQFEFLKFSEALMKTMNVKTAVLPPIMIPILNLGSTFVPWEESIMENLHFLEEDDFQSCFDEKSGMFVCKLCMSCSFVEVDLQAHKCSSISNSHRELSYLFKQYYSIWKREFEKMKQFTEKVINEESKPAPRRNHEASEYGGSSFEGLERHLGIIQELNEEQENQIVCKDFYDVPVLPNQDQKNAHMYQHQTAFNPYSLASIKRKIDSVIESSTTTTTTTSCDGNSQRELVSGNISVHEALRDYFDEDEVSILNNMNLFAHFK